MHVDGADPVLYPLHPRLFRLFPLGQRLAHFVLEPVQFIPNLLPVRVDLLRDFLVLVGQFLADAVKVGLGLRDLVRHGCDFLPALRGGHVRRELGHDLPDGVQNRVHLLGLGEDGQGCGGFDDNQCCFGLFFTHFCLILAFKVSVLYLMRIVLPLNRNPPPTAPSTRWPFGAVAVNPVQ